MRTKPIALLSLALALPCAGNPLLMLAEKPVAAGPTPVWTETFEGANSGCDNAPNSTTGTPDFGYTTWANDGSESAYFTAEVPNDLARWSITAADEYYFAWAWRPVGGTAFTGVTIATIGLLDASNNALSDMWVRVDAGSQRDVHVISSGASAVEANANVWTAGTTYYCLLHAKKGTGSDAVSELWVTTDGNFSGSSLISASTGTWTAQIARVRITSLNYSGSSHAFDGLKIYTTKPSSY